MRGALPALALAGCANVLGIPSETSVESFAVGANVLGMHDATANPLRLTLDADDSNPQMIEVTQDGDIAFPKGLLNGLTFHVQAPGSCKVTGDGRPIENAGTRVDVRCDGLLSLGDFNFSAPLETTGAGTSFHTVGSLLVEHTALAAKPFYEQSNATAYKSGVAVTSLGVSIRSGDSFEVKVTNITSGLAMDMRSYFTTVDLGGPPKQFGYGKPPMPSGPGHYGSAIDTFEDYVLIGLPDDGPGHAVLYQRYGRTWTEIHAFDGEMGRYGAAVAIGKDRVAGKLVVAVGAPGLDKVYVYKQNGTLWDLTSFPGTGEYGAALAIEKVDSGKLLLVGAPSAISGGVPNAGHVDAIDIQSLAYVSGYQAITPTAGARFGAAIGITANEHAIVVGAPSETSAGYEEAGAAYVIWLDNRQAMQRIAAATPGAGDHFGAAVAVNGDASIVAVGAPLEDSGTTNPSDNSTDAAGAVYLFGPGNATGTYVKATNADVGDGFGTSVALRGNTADGTILVVGAPYEDSGSAGVFAQVTADENAPDAGAAYVYTLAGTTPTLAYWLKASNAATGDAFGARVTLTPESLLVAAPYEDSAATGWNNGQGDGDIDGDNGAVYAFR